MGIFTCRNNTIIIYYSKIVKDDYSNIDKFCLIQIALTGLEIKELWYIDPNLNRINMNKSFISEFIEGVVIIIYKNGHNISDYTIPYIRD